MSQIDVSDFVECQEGSKSLHFSDPKQQAKFELAVCMAVHNWEELNTAVTNQWGGSDSEDKRDWISAIVIDSFDHKVIDLSYIEELLLNSMLDEFETNVDNDSALITAALILKLYREVALQNYNTVDGLYSKWEEKQRNKSSIVEKVVIQEDPNNPDSSDDEGDEEEIPQLTETDSMDIDEEPRAPLIDDDGFELVQRKGKSRR